MSLLHLKMVHKLPKEAAVKSILMLYLVMELSIKKREFPDLFSGGSCFESRLGYRLKLRISRSFVVSPEE
jgi:hypothetical protein